MRSKIIELLKSLEKEGRFKVEYTEFLEEYYLEYDFIESIEFPNYRLIVDKFTMHQSISGNAIKAELKRMEADGYVIIATQKGRRWAEPNGNGPDIDGHDFSCESIVLSTRGRLGWYYFVHEFKQNPLTALLSLAALCVSAVAILVSIM